MCIDEEGSERTEEEDEKDGNVQNQRCSGSPGEEDGNSTSEHNTIT